MNKGEKRKIKGEKEKNKEIKKKKTNSSKKEAKESLHPALMAPIPSSRETKKYLFKKKKKKKKKKSIASKTKKKERKERNKSKNLHWGFCGLFRAVKCSIAAFEKKKKKQSQKKEKKKMKKKEEYLCTIKKIHSITCFLCHRGTCVHKKKNNHLVAHKKNNFGPKTNSLNTRCKQNF